MALAVVSLGATAPARAQVAMPKPLGTASVARAESREARAERWKEALEAFAAIDRLQAPRPGGVLFVGSSSIRLWEGLERDFGAWPIVTKRGFGGSRLSDCSELVAQLVLPYQPRLIVLYAGDNDLAEGATPEEVLRSFTQFVEEVRRELPDTRIAYVSIKPSPSRAALMQKAQATNALIEGYVDRTPNLAYVDIYQRMIGADGRPRPELFGPDMLHLNRAGYAVWRQAIEARVAPEARPDPTRYERRETTLAATAGRRAAP